jgi:fructose/tagatose bisphosphate aldolase
VALLFNESPDRAWVSEAIRLGFNAVMYSNEADGGNDAIAGMVVEAHAAGVAVEAELDALAGVAGDLGQAGGQDLRLTDFGQARDFVEQTGIDALAVNVGQIHLHGRKPVGLDLARLKVLAELPIPLVLHGATSVTSGDLASAVRLGVAKINVGSRLKQSYFAALRQAALAAGEHPANPYEVIGSGLASDVLMAGRLAMQRDVERLMGLFESAGKS